MPSSVIKIIGGSYDLSTLTFTLRVKFIRGKPAYGDGLTIFQTVLTITEIKPRLYKDEQEITATSTIEFLGNIDPLLNSMENTELLCGLNLLDYKTLPSSGKLAFFKEFADLYTTSKVSDFIKDHLRLCIGFFPVDKQSLTGISKLGGLPDVPPGFLYPKDRHGKSPLFIAQIHIGELNQWVESTKEFKGDGILYFFGTIKITHDTYYSFDEIMVRYSVQTAGLIKLSLPDDLSHFGRFEEKDLMAVEEIDIPPYDCSITGRAGFTEKELSSYMEFEEIMGSRNYFDPPSGSYYDHIKFMGYPQQCKPLTRTTTEF